jgi:uncharacterized protein (DUF362 family)
MYPGRACYGARMRTFDQSGQSPLARFHLRAAASRLGRASAALATPGPLPGPKSGPGRSLIARARREGLVGADARFATDKLKDGLGAAVARAAGEKTPVEAFRRLFRPTDIVGLKVNCIAGKGLSTRPEVALVLADWLQQAGVPARNIVIWDRTDRELKNAGYTLNRDGSGVRVLGTNDAYDAKVQEWGPSASCFAKILVDDITALINLPVLKDHALSGASFGMKNWYGAVNNPNKLHADNCVPFIPHLAAFPPIHDKVRLTVIDGSIGQCHAGPGRSPRWAWPYNGFLASTDPVAIDAIGWQVIEARRKEVGLPSLAAEKREPLYIADAGKLGLGVADLRNVQVEDV